MTRRISDVCSEFSVKGVKKIPKKREAKNSSDKKVVLGVLSMKDHMTDEGWQITHGLSLNGFLHCGYGLDFDCVDAKKILEETKPGTLVIQDIREWDVAPRDFRDKKARFTNTNAIEKRGDIFRLTILKDSQQRPNYHYWACVKMGIDAWIVYYSPRIVAKLAPYVREEHLIRTYHSVDSSIVPEYSAEGRSGCLFSGAVSSAYPLRQRIMASLSELPVTVMKHPGYHRNGSVVKPFLESLSRYKVSICTSSRYGYALRKLIESSACGCKVITDLPVDDVLPAIDRNLVRVPSGISMSELAEIIKHEESSYDPVFQKSVADDAVDFYDFRAVTCRLSEDIEKMRSSY
jgi:hypothetical protein